MSDRGKPKPLKVVPGSTPDDLPFYSLPAEGVIDLPHFRDVQFTELRIDQPKLLDQALSIFGSKSKAGDWLTSACPALNGQIPWDLVKRGDVEDVEIELGRIEHGIYV